MDRVDSNIIKRKLNSSWGRRRSGDLTFCVHDFQMENSAYSRRERETDDRM